MRIRTGLATGLLLVLAVAGCGTADGGGEVATAGGGGSTTSSAAPNADGERAQGLRYSQCMRDNGVPEFPDPEIGKDGGMSLDLPEGVDPQAVDAAQRECKQYLPNGGEPGKADPQVVAKLREYSRCMRENGVPRFPDPTDAGLQVENDELGIDPNSPAFKEAERKCASLRPSGRGDEPGLSDGEGR
ncbi:hypothetical protein ACFXGA_15400 [Actinosynnema sp. NPDC059335]|uniref:hypothetical protein n=1 Tax=Actinosynnema sp. NPDC059335 TaxID=3346804 RepID=UPI003670F0DD